MKKVFIILPLILVCVMLMSFSFTDEGAIPVIRDAPPEQTDAPNVVRYKNGNVYEGDLVEGLPHGVGTLKYEDGSFFSGEFKNGAICGKGEYSFPGSDDPSSPLKLSGTFSSDELTSHDATLTYADGSIYCGSVRDGLRHGYGEYNWSNGSWYKGGFIDDEPSGSGSLFNSSDGIIYTGECVGGLMQGEAVVTFPDGTTASCMLKDGLIDGSVTISYDENKYVTVNGKTYFVEASEGLTLNYCMGKLEDVALATH